MRNELIDLIRLMNEKPIAFNRHYVALGCGINGALMLSQLVYWADKSKNPNGWIYKTSTEWTEETGLTRREQDTARKNLRELGFMDEVLQGVPAKLHYRVNQDNLYSKLIELAKEKSNAQIRQTGAQIRQTGAQIRQTGAQIRQTGAQIRQTITENTTEISSYITSEIHPEVARVLKLWEPDLNLLNSRLAIAGEKQLTVQQVIPILAEVNSHYEKMIEVGSVSHNKMYSNFVNWVKGDYAKHRKPSRSASAPVNNKNVNQAWGQEQYYAPVSETENEGDLL